jgi:hypothetical protein
MKYLVSQITPLQLVTPYIELTSFSLSYLKSCLKSHSKGKDFFYKRNLSGFGNYNHHDHGKWNIIFILSGEERAYLHIYHVIFVTTDIVDDHEWSRGTPQFLFNENPFINDKVSFYLRQVMGSCSSLGISHVYLTA